MEPQELAESIQEELDKHQRLRSEEESRHEDRMDALRSEAGLKELQDAAERVKDLSNKKGKLEEEIKSSFFKVVQSLAPRQRQSGDRVTIRDNAVWNYGRSSKVSLERILKKQEIQDEIRSLIEEDNRELFDTLMEDIRQIEIDDSSRWSVSFVEPKEIRQAPDNVQFKWLGIKSESPRSIGFGDAKNNLFGWGSSSMSPTDDQPARLKNLVQCRDTILTMYETLEDDLQERVDLREDIKKSITTRASKHLVASSI